MKFYSLLLLLTLVSGASHASLLTFKVEGQISSVAPELSSINTGDLFEAYYTFNPLALDTNPSISRGQYALESLVLSIGSFTASTINSNKGSIFVDDRSLVGSSDQYTINTSTPSGFYSHTASLIGGRELIAIVMQLTDNDANVFSSDSLPTYPLNINEFESAQLELLFSNDWQPGVAFDAKWIYGNIISISSVSNIPEPSTYLMIALGLLGLISITRRRIFVINTP